MRRHADGVGGEAGGARDVEGERADELAKLPKPASKKRRCFGPDEGPNGETLETHDRHYEHMKSGAGKGQMHKVEIWTKKQKVE